MKLLHLNVEQFKLFDNIKQFVKDTDPDIICMQEAINSPEGYPLIPLMVSHQIPLGPYLEYFQSEGYKVVFEPMLIREFSKGMAHNFGNCILVKNGIEIIIKEVLWDQPLGTTQSIRNLDTDNQVSGKIKSDRNSVYQYIQQETKNYIILTLQSPDQKQFKIATTHWMATASCSECESHIRMAKQFQEYIKNETFQIILTGDFNITIESGVNSLLPLSNSMHTRTSFANTLDRNIHYIHINNLIPKGLGVDHIMTKNLNQLSVELIQETLSDHQGLWVEFEV
jgi:endonuclease/exonuclease/phosphatase family metal-dependent hydrolase